jgi:molybdopterin-guanine dinucleotide biosynthesis protein A
MWTGAILAGGQGRRLGGADKAALRVGGHRIIDRQLALLRRLTPHIIIVVSNSSLCRDEAPGTRVVLDHVPGAGSLGALYTALQESISEQVLVLASDMPFVSASLLTCLAKAGALAEAAVPVDARGLHPACASYQRRVAPRLRRRIDAGTLSLVDALDDLSVTRLEPDTLHVVDPTHRALLNVNTPEDYALALSMAHD